MNLSHPDFYSKRTLEAPKVWTKCICSSVTIVFDVKFINALLQNGYVSYSPCCAKYFRKVSRISMSCPSGDAKVTVTFNGNCMALAFLSWRHFRAVPS